MPATPSLLLVSAAVIPAQQPEGPAAARAFAAQGADYKNGSRACLHF